MQWIQKSWIGRDPLHEKLTNKERNLERYTLSNFSIFLLILFFSHFFKDIYKEKYHLSCFFWNPKITLLNWKCTFWPISTALCVAVLFILLNARTTTIIVTYDLTESSPRDHNGPKRFKIVYVLVNFSAKDSQVCLSLQWNHPFTYKSFKNSESRFLYTRKMLGCIAPVLLELMALDQRSQFNRFRVPLPDRPSTSGLRTICDCTRPAPRHF